MPSLSASESLPYPESPPRNDAEQAAQLLLDTADGLGAAIDLVETLTRSPQSPIKDEEHAADTVLIAAPEVISALRRLAMRLDRGAYFGRG